jgi:hypothetical protein
MVQDMARIKCRLFRVLPAVEMLERMVSTEIFIIILSVCLFTAQCNEET